MLIIAKQQLRYDQTIIFNETRHVNFQIHDNDISKELIKDYKFHTEASISDTLFDETRILHLRQA